MSFSSFYIYLEPKWPLFFEGQPPKTRPFQTQTRVIKGFPGKYIHLSIGSAPLELSRTTLSPLLDWGCRSCETDRYFGKRRSIRVGVLGGVNQKSKKTRNLVPNPGQTHRNGEKTPCLKLTEKKETENMPKLPKEGQILSNGFFWSQNVTRFKYRRLFVKNQRSTKQRICGMF